MNLKLSAYDENMLSGRQGKARQLAMETMVKVAKAFNVEEFTDIVSVQTISQFGELHVSGSGWVERLTCMGGKCCVPTTQDPASIPFSVYKEMGYDETIAENQLRLQDMIIELGQLPTWSCTPYYQGNTPRFGQNVAWAESSSVSYANSVLGARTNRTPAGIDLCAALTGRIPKYGLYLTESRRAQIKVVLEAGELSDLDYNTLGIILGKVCGEKIPCIYGMPPTASNDNLKQLGAAAASSGSVALFHAIGVTPEAMLSDPFDIHKPEDEILVTRKMLEETQQSLSTKNPGDVDLVVVGCPHSSSSEVIEIHKLMSGEKVKKGKQFWIYTTLETESLMERMGIVDQLKEAGVLILSQNCLMVGQLVGSYGTLMTNSGKFASYIPSEFAVELVYGSTEDCVRAVIQ